MNTTSVSLTPSLSFYEICAKALKLNRQCGRWATARWLDKQGIPVETAVALLCPRVNRHDTRAA